jgi:hypothetical protein
VCATAADVAAEQIKMSFDEEFEIAMAQIAAEAAARANCKLTS